MTTPPIAVVGENLVDLLVDPDTSVNAVVGGGPLNVARTIGRLGGDARFFSGVSEDAFGSLVVAALSESHVHLALAGTKPEPTTLAVVELSTTSPRYHFHLKGTAAFALDAAEATSAMGAIDNLSALYFGTLGLLVEPMASVGETLVVSARPEVMVVIDPNCRPSAIDDHVGYRQRVTRLCARADVMKVSTEDLAYLYPDIDELEGARTLLGHGARCVIVTDGAAAVRVLNAQSELLLPVEPTDVVDTVGAGDALVGGFLTWWTGNGLTRDDLTDSASLEAAVRAAIDISRRTCQRAGAQPPRRDEVNDLESWRWL